MVCGRKGCEQCQTLFGFTQRVIERRASGPTSVDVGFFSVSVPGSEGGLEAQGKPQPQRVCSMECFDRWAWSYISEGYTPVVKGEYVMLGGVFLSPQAAMRAQRIAHDFLSSRRAAHAKSLIAAENFEAAAKIYEELGMWNEAGEARRLGRRQVVTHVQVNLNDLIQQLRQGGVTTDYVCPSCGGSIQISGATALSSLTNCQYCGVVLRTTDLAAFLTRIVGR